jgi:hypothetical protein
MPPRAEAARSLLGVGGENLGALVDQPLRRCRGRRAHDDLQSGVAQGGERIVEPVPVELAAPRLEPAPGKLADANQSDPELDHAPGVLGPRLAGPMFRVVADAQHAGHSLSR